MANKNTKSVEIKSCFLYDVSGSKYDISGAVNGFSYYESIFKPFVTGVMNITDSGSNFISTLPIQGGELVSITISDVEGEEFTYNLHVWKVYGRIFTKGLQAYNLALISKEALYNEGVRLTKKLSGTPDSIVKKILEESLNTEKEVSTETCKYEVNFYPNGKKAHIIIQSLAQKALPNTSGKAKTTVGTTTTGGKSELSTDTKKSSGTAGYLFFENRNGFHFRSIDFYYSTGNDNFKGDSEVATYTAKPNLDNPDRFVIEEYGFTSELDLIEQMRNGTYASHLVAYNYATGYYEEFSYNLQENFENMAHLGSQSKLGKTQQDLSINPTRVMTVLVDHETWNSKETSGSNEERDNPAGNGSNYPDYQKHWLSQSIARRYFMENQKLEIEIAGNMNLTVGDKLTVILPNMASSKSRDEESVDRENSGTYLISSISHNSVFLNNNACVSRVELIRDIYGMKDETSNVK